MAFESQKDEAAAAQKAESHNHATAPHDHASDAHNHTTEHEEPELVSRSVQAGLGLFVAVLVYSAAFGGLFGLAFDLMLDRDVNERLTPRMVEEILGITSAERRRWTKDRRLPTSGMASYRWGPQSFYLCLHPPKKIGQIANNPGLVAQWRNEDAARLSELHRTSES